MEILSKINRKLDDVSPVFKNMNKDLSELPRWFKTTSAIVTGFALGACSSRAGQPTISHEPGITPDNGTPTSPIPSPDVESNNGVYQTEVYCSDDLALCAFHQFDNNGNALAPRASINTKINFDLENNSIVITGDPIIRDDSEVFIYPEQNGQKGYETQQVITVEEAVKWMKNMSEDKKDDVQIAIDEAKESGTDIRFIMKTVLNIGKDDKGEDTLINMTGGIAMSAGTEGSTIIELSDVMEPITNNALLKDQQITALDFVPAFGDAESLVMEVYPSSWVEVGDGQWVSPKFLTVQEFISSKGEDFTLMPDGTIQETTENGVSTIPNIKVDKKGTLILTINSEKVVIDEADLIISNEEGLKIKGYKLEGDKWLPEVSYNIVKNPKETNISVITISDLQSGNLPKFEHSIDAQINTDPSRIDFIFWNATNSYSLETNKKDGAPFESVKAAGLKSIYKTSFEPFGFDKDGYVANYTYKDKTGQETEFHFILTEKQVQYLLEKNFFNNPSAKLVPVDKLSPGGADLFYIDGKPGSSDDMRDINETLYPKQGYSIEEIQELFKRIAESDTISESDRKIIESLLFHGNPQLTNTN